MMTGLNLYDGSLEISLLCGTESNRHDTAWVTKKKTENYVTLKWSPRTCGRHVLRAARRAFPGGMLPQENFYFQHGFLDF